MQSWAWITWSQLLVSGCCYSTPSFYHLVPPPQFSSPSKHFWRKFWCYHPSWPLKDFFLSFVDSVSIHPINTYIDTYINGRRFNLSQEIHHSKRNHQSEFEPKLADHYWTWAVDSWMILSCCWSTPSRADPMMMDSVVGRPISHRWWSAGFGAPFDR